MVPAARKGRNVPVGEGVGIRKGKRVVTVRKSVQHSCAKKKQVRNVNDHVPARVKGSERARRRFVANLW
jgi:hypothetical protein